MTQILIVYVLPTSFFSSLWICFFCDFYSDPLIGYVSAGHVTCSGTFFSLLTLSGGAAYVYWASENVYRLPSSLSAHPVLHTLNSKEKHILTSLTYSLLKHRVPSWVNYLPKKAPCVYISSALCHSKKLLTFVRVSVTLLLLIRVSPLGTIIVRLLHSLAFSLCLRIWAANVTVTKTARDVTRLGCNSFECYQRRWDCYILQSRESSNLQSLKEPPIRLL